MCVFRAVLLKEVPSNQKIAEFSPLKKKVGLFSPIVLTKNAQTPVSHFFCPFDLSISIYAVRLVPLSLPSHCHESKHFERTNYSWERRQRG